ncbi:MAG: RNA polymerase sigma factor [Candidatus Aminicenantes bacterium]|nr:RNA polymerase sigma factor [Candidatus Aminicenantes bacterium]
MLSRMGNILVNHGNAAAAAVELDNFGALLVIEQVMKGLFGNDSYLLQTVIGGDEAGWQKFILKYANYIFGAIGKYCEDQDEKMAVFLQVLEKLREDRFARLRRFEGNAKISTWLTVVARRLAIDFLRAKYGRDFRLKKIRVVSYDAVPAFLKHVATAATPEHEMAGAEQRQAREKLEQELQRALACLSARESTAIQLVYFKGLKIKEAGKLLQQSSMYKFLARALEKVRNEMESRPRFSRADVSAALAEEAHE